MPVSLGEVVHFCGKELVEGDGANGMLAGLQYAHSPQSLRA